METANFDKEYFDGKQRRGVLSLSNLALLRLIKSRTPNSGSKDLRALEIGSAYGDFGVALKEIFPQLVATDISDYAIEEGKRRHPELDLQLMNFEEDELPADYVDAFDAVVSLHTFEHFHNPDIPIKKIHKALKADGVAFLIMPNPEIWVGKILKLFGKEKAIPVFGDDTHFSLHNQAEWIKRLSEAGFNIETMGRPAYVLKHPLLDKIYGDNYYTTFLQRSGFELLFICTKK